MVDIHAHILPGIDDGSRTMEESIEIVRNASKCGVTDLVVTPHFILGSSYGTENQEKKKLLEELKKEVQKENIDIRLYLGNEVFVENNMLDLLKEGKIVTLNNSRYLLFELPMNNEYNGIKDIIFQLRLQGCVPVIAHPERYLFFQKHPEIMMDLLEQGALFQSNIGSFYGDYGKEAKKLFILLLKHHMIHFISSDIHHKKDTFYEKIELLKENLKKYISEEEIEELFSKNAIHVIRDEKFEARDFIPFKRTFFGSWK